MKKNFLFVSAILSLVIISSCKKEATPTPEPTPTPTPKIEIGASYQGGIIAYIDSSGLHGFIAAPSDQVNSEWGCNGTVITGADGKKIGTGMQNTKDIVNGCSMASIAARVCDDLVLGGYSDWYLPSQEEAKAMYIKKDIIKGFLQSNYWTSTEYSGDFAYIMDFRNGTGGSTSEYTNKFAANSFPIRAIRSF